MSILEVSARLKVRPGQLDGFKRQAAEIVKLAKERGDKRVAAECLQGLGHDVERQHDVALLVDLDDRALQDHRDPLQAVGELGGDRRELEPLLVARVVKVVLLVELRDEAVGPVAEAVEVRRGEWWRRAGHGFVG